MLGRQGEVQGAVIIGFENLHLYIREALWLMVLPSILDIRMHKINHEDIVKIILKYQDKCKCERHEVINQKSVITAVKEQEVEAVAEFWSKMKEGLK